MNYLTFVKYSKSVVLTNNVKTNYKIQTLFNDEKIQNKF